MYVYHYCFYFLAFVVLIINARYIERSLDNERDEDFYLPNHYHMSRTYRPGSLERYLRNLVAFDLYNDEKSDESVPFDRRSKAITKGDPREFMG